MDAESERENIVAKRDQEEGIGRMPGTGDDYIDTQDVEGHRASRVPGGEEARRDTDGEGLRRDADLGARRDTDDVEGHRFITPFQGGESELIRRVPGDNPHGDR